MTRYGGILSSLPTGQRRRRSHSDHVSKGKFFQRKTTNVDTRISLTGHTLDSTICKIYVEPQDEVPIAQLSTLVDMIKNREWDLLSNELSPETLRVAAHEDLSEDKGSLLHLALHFDAPLSIISQITNGIHTSVHHQDAKGRLPLHVAISKVVQLSIISHLLLLNPRACTSKDDQGKVPLHICFDENVLHAFKPSQFKELVRTLIQTSAEALTIEDHNRRCPVELAILSDAPLKTLLFMQVMKRDYLRQQKCLMSSTTTSCSQNTVVVKKISSTRLASGRIGVTMFRLAFG